MADEECVAFLQWALPRMGMRWAGFRKVRRQVCRRIRGRIAELELGSYEDYRRLLEGRRRSSGMSGSGARDRVGVDRRAAGPAAVPPGGCGTRRREQAAGSARSTATKREPGRPAALLRVFVALASWTTVSACAGETVVRLADYAAHQRDQVTTRRVPATSALASRLLSDGWRIAREGEPAPVARMTGELARVWFFSARGETAAVALHGRALRRGRLTYRVNGLAQGSVALAEQKGALELPFQGPASRVGWNVLDLHFETERPAGRGEGAVLELIALGFRDPTEARVDVEEIQQ